MPTVSCYAKDFDFIEQKHKPLQIMETLSKDKARDSMLSESLYRTLPSTKSIRLLQLQPGVGNSITTSLELIEDYSKCPPYHALSYCWGDANDTVDLTCNGETIQVTTSVHHALSHLRRKYQPCLIWCDAICINQKSLPERNQQVSIMDKIYRHASRVYVWLGLDNKETKDALAILLEIAHRIHDHNDHDNPFDAWLSQLSTRTDRLAVITQAYPMQEAACSSEQWKLLGRFYNANWFCRIWVIQEIRGSTEGWVLCGKFEVRWEIVALVATWISLAVPWREGIDWKKKYFGSYRGFRNAKFMWDQTFATCREAPFLALLHRTRAFQSTDARDKVFSMLHHHITRHDIDLHQYRVDGNVQNSIQSSSLELQADYVLSTKNVYRQVAIQSLQRYNNAEVLCYAWQTSGHDVSWPSWIPRWDLSLLEENEMTVIPFLYDASQHSSLDFRLSLDHNILFLRGINLGTIVNTTRNLIYPIFGTQDTSPGHTVEDQLQAMAKMITQDRWQDKPFDETSARRTQHHVQAQFAGFSAYILPLLKNHGEDCSVSLMVATWCDFCEEYFHPRRNQASSTPSEYYHCYICGNGSCDICLQCYTKGMRCEVSSHVLKKQTVKTLSIPHTDSILRILEAHAPAGDRERFQNLISVTCRGSTFFSVSQGLHGTASGAIESGDVVAILFGSRVPFILRKHSLGYRLVSICYVQGLMDGEAMVMLKNGELESEMFDIC